MSHIDNNTYENRRYGQPETPVDTAIILAAGAGNRLHPLTNSCPKCLIPVSGVPILVNMLNNLSDYGITKVVIVVGYLKEKICEEISNHFRGMDITYLESERFNTTNNIFSLWLAREYLKEDVLLLESDLHFEGDLINRIVHAQGTNQMAVARHKPWMSGTIVRLDNDKVTSIIESKDQNPSSEYLDHYKTVNIYRLSGEFLRNHFVPCLSNYINKGYVNEYYESVLNELNRQGKLDMNAVYCDDVKWIEIDNPNDLTSANYMFSNQEERYEHVSGLFGEYWRYKFVDHSLLYNLFYPPKAVLDDLANHIREITLNYPSAQKEIAALMGVLIGHSPENIIVGNGASELIKVVCKYLKRRIIVPVPSFNEWINAVPEGLVNVTLLEPPDFLLDVEKFLHQAVQHSSDMVVIVNPNNPTSLLTPKSDLYWLAGQLEKKEITLVVDESFIDFVDDVKGSTIENEIDQFNNLVIMKSLSKCYGIGGIRLGYLLTKNGEFLKAAKDEIPIWNINGFAEAFLRVAPRFRKEYVRSCALVREARHDFYNHLITVPGLTVYEPQANFVFCRLPDDTIPGPEFTKKLFVNENILIKDCAGKMIPEADRYLRIASRTREENKNLVEALKRNLGK